MKVIAYYLPQFHEIPENNEWWGKGFTEWNNVKKGEALFKNHNQPRVPLEGYYNLMDKEVMIHQAELANTYGIYGMAFYHYWFEGKMLLEKPAENLLQWKDIPMNFMFFWANHDWFRSWEGKKTMLQKQTYGGEEDWKQHFDYMLPFFKDERYMRIKGKPAIGIYMISAIPNFDEMIKYWNKLAVDNELGGLYVIESFTHHNYVPSSKSVDAITIREPNVSMHHQSRFYSRSKAYPALQRFIPGCYPGKFSYERTKRDALDFASNFRYDGDIILGDFVGWDNTCRHKRRGSVLIGQTPEIFGQYLHKMKELAEQRNIEFLFLNAWNEWCEGMYLEPDTVSEYAYLEAIKKVLDEDSNKNGNLLDGVKLWD